MRRASALQSLPSLTSIGLFLIALFLFTAPVAAASAPHWKLTVTPNPTNLKPGGTATLSVLAWNVGGAAADPSGPVRITDSLPAGLTPTAIRSETQLGGPPIAETMNCSLVPQPTCTWSPEIAPFGESLTSYGYLEVQIKVEVEGSPRSTLDEAVIEGGEAPPQTINQPLTISGDSAPFGFERYEISPENSDGTLDTQAGSHPFQLTTSLGLNSTFEAGVIKPTAMPKNLHISLPPGLVGDPEAVPQCTSEEFTTVTQFHNLCPQDTAVGVVLITVREPAAKLNNGREPYTRVEPLFNLSPRPGEPARLGFLGVVVPIVLDTAVRSGGDYGVTVSSERIPQTTELLSSQVSVWGDPGDTAHDSSRGWACLYSGPGARGFGETCLPPDTSQAFLSLPTSCRTPFRSTVSGDSWASPSRPAETAEPISDELRDSAGEPLTLGGCARLPFSPEVSFSPDVTSADSASGAMVTFDLPQETTLSPLGLAESAVEGTVVSLPQGLRLNPASADGLGSCSEAEIGYSGTGPEGSPQFTGLPSASCPPASKVGTVRIATPLLPRELQGGVYLATPYRNPFGSLLGLYIVAEDPVPGVLVKLAGKVSLDPASGQIVASFSQTPQLPFDELTVGLFDGPHAPLSTPADCGSYSTTMSIAPWSASAVKTNVSSFTIGSGANGGRCVESEGEEPSSPGFDAGTTTPIAGAYSQFDLQVSREDGEQKLATVRTVLPEGLVGNLTGIPYCSESELTAAETKPPGSGVEELASPSCPAASQVGTVESALGTGTSPFQAAGKVYLAGPYKGAPLSLAVITPALAGPFDLGDVVVRVALHVNAETAQVEAVSDPLPAILQGIPLDIRSVALKLDRQNFTLNPTSCAEKQISGQIISRAGAVADVSNRFQVGGCRALGFKPKLSLEFEGSPRRSAHPSFKAVLTYPRQGANANLARVQVGLPGTELLDQGNLDRVCQQPELAAGQCPKRSIYGHARAWTPLLDKPLEGPVYLGVGFGHKLPDLVAELNGQIRLLLHAKIDEDSDKGLRSTFEVVPDAPVSKFELTLKGGPKYGLLENTEGVCAKAQRAFVKLVSQNGKADQYRRRIQNGCKRAS